MISALYLSAFLVACLPESNMICSGVAPIISPTVTSQTTPISIQSASPFTTHSPVKSTAKRMSDITLSNADNGKTMTLRLGQKIILRLNENPTTGYRWSISALNSQILQLIDDRFDLPNTSARGGDGQRILTFRANQLGRVNLNLKNRREWEDEASALESFNLTLQVTQ